MKLKVRTKYFSALIAAMVIFLTGFGLLNFSYFKTYALYLIGNLNHSVTAPLEPSQTELIELEPNELMIPKLSIRTPILYATEKSERHFQELLQDGVVHFPGTPQPGEYGNAYIFGHSSDFALSRGSYKTVFALLPEIREQDVILITNEAGDRFTYVVTETKVVSPDDFSVLDQYNNEKRMLTIQTSYPIGTALKRFIVVAEILDEEQE